jgi:hypothetical protein
MLMAAERTRVVARDPGEDPTSGGAELEVERLVAAVVAEGEDLGDVLPVFGLHRGPVKGLVGQRLHVETLQRVGVANGLDQLVEEVELAAGEVVAGERHVELAVGVVVGAEEPGVDGAQMANRRSGR